MTAEHTSARRAAVDLLLVLRVHIVAIAFFGALVFGWLLTGRYLPLVAWVVGLDWLLVNVMNRVSDLAEDAANGIPGTSFAARARGFIVAAYLVAFVGSLVLTHAWRPELTPWRLFMQATGFLYNFRLIPTPRGRVRLKQLYVFKNLMSALGFVTTCFLYPASVVGYHLVLGWPTIVALMLYFVPFELTYEIVYDLRDVPGDRAAGVPTYPVVHGEVVTARIIDGLLAASILWLMVSFLIGLIGVRELLMALGPAIQWLVIRRLLRRRTPTTDDCVRLTNLGWAMLALYLACTALWIAAGLPANIFI